MAENPYASPPMFSEQRPEIENFDHPDQLVIATQGKRFLNMVIDNIFMWVVNMGVGIAVGVFYVVINGGPLNPQDEVSLRLISFAVGIGISMLYFIITEGIYQKSVGKFITGTKVVTATGGRPTFGQIVGRTFARFIPFEAFSFLSGSKPVGWHDSLSGTRVIMVR